MLRTLQSFAGVLLEYWTGVTEGLAAMLRRIADGGASSKQKERRERNDPQPQPESPYSDQYETIIRQGHTRPIPELGAPALVWHVGIWPRKFVKGSENHPEACDPHDTFSLKYTEARREYDSRRTAWVSQVNDFVRRLQVAGCQPRTDGQPAKLREFISYVPHELLTPRTAGNHKPSTSAGDEIGPTEVLQNETFGFTIWWRDQPGDPIDNAIRVRVQAELNADYAAFSFYIDLGQPWDQPRLPAGGDKPGRRRRDAFAAVADVKRICEAQLKPLAPGKAVAAVDRPLLPEQLASPDGRSPAQLDQALMAARNLLYMSLWEDFCRDFNCSVEAIAGERGEVFANFRGLVLATDGIRADKPGWADYADHMGSLGTQDFPRFDSKGAEPNAVLKAFWPFVRRVTIDADYRDFIACGVLDWRALYVTALGASNQYDENAERRPAVHNRSELDFVGQDSQIMERVGRPGYNHPVRYLFLVKHDAHPRQLGRIVERINTMGTLRLFALKDWSAINDADPFIRMLGQELDQKMRNWSRKRNKIDRWKTVGDFRSAQEEERRKQEAVEKAGIKEDDEKDFRELLEVQLPGRIEGLVKGLFARAGVFFLKSYSSIVRREEHNRLQDTKFEALYQVTKRIESSLIDISTRLDDVGARCVGGLHFRLYRSHFYVKEFNMLLETLRVGNVPTWVSYDRWVERGLQPTFDFIEDVGTRLRALRNRLQSVMDAIETSALVVQSEATRHNTAVLRNIVTVGILMLIAYVFRVRDMVTSIPSPLRSIKLPDLPSILDKLHNFWDSLYVAIGNISEWLHHLIGLLTGL